MTSVSSTCNHPFHAIPRTSRANPNRPLLLRRLRNGSFSPIAKISIGKRLLGLQFVTASVENPNKFLARKPVVFFLDVNPLCYRGSQPSVQSFTRWLSLFFSEVSHHNPVIAVLDGEDGNEFRRKLLPSYKSHRKRFNRHWRNPQRGSTASASSSESLVTNILQKCNVPVIKVNGYEADDVVATLTDQVVQRGYRVVIGSPDKDFKQLISEDVKIVMPLANLGRWSFYAMKHYIEQYKCHPSSDLSLRCIIGDEVDGVPGIQHVAPQFGRKTALKLLRRHGSLANLLGAAAVRTVGKPYAQDALTKHADYLWRNFEVLTLRRDAVVHFEEDWLLERDARNDFIVLSGFVDVLDKQKG